MTKKKETLKDKVIDQDASSQETKLVTPKKNLAPRKPKAEPVKVLEPQIPIHTHPELSKNESITPWWYPGALIVLSLTIVGLVIWAAMEQADYISSFF